jgi:hypothetical protein
MKKILVIAAYFLCAMHMPAWAITPSVPVDSLKTCILNNDAASCKTLLTPNSFTLFDRFASYGLLVCVPSNWTVESEKRQNASTIITASIPASNRSRYITRMVYRGNKLDIPASLRLGMGEKWESKINLSEQLYLMMKQNMADKLTCDTIASIIEPKGK